MTLAFNDPETAGFSSVQSCSQLELLDLPCLNRFKVAAPALLKQMSVRSGSDLCILIIIQHNFEPILSCFGICTGATCVSKTYQFYMPLHRGSDINCFQLQIRLVSWDIHSKFLSLRGLRGAISHLISALRDIPALPTGKAKNLLWPKCCHCQLAVSVYSYIAVLAKISNIKLCKLPLYQNYET